MPTSAATMARKCDFRKVLIAAPRSMTRFVAPIANYFRPAIFCIMAAFLAFQTYHNGQNDNSGVTVDFFVR